jgi:hypothetical protein
MKRILYILSICYLALLTACSKENAQPATEQPIGFDVTDLQQTRAAVEAIGDIKTLGIFGYSTGAAPFNPLTDAPIFLHNRLAELQTSGIWKGKWVCNPMAYWSQDSTVLHTFVAYSPHSSRFPLDADIAVTSATTIGFPKITYTVPSKVEEHTDILYCEMNDEKNQNIKKSVPDGTAQYSMKHALTRIKFYIAAAPKSGTGTAWYNVTSLSFTSSDLITRATLNLETGTWSNVNTGPATYTFDVDPWVGIYEGDVDEISIINGDNGSLMLFPQMITGATVSISYTYSGDMGGEEYTFSSPFPNVQLNAGKLSVFIIRIDIGGVKIEFKNDIDNVIKAWDDNNGNMYDAGEFEVY